MAVMLTGHEGPAEVRAVQDALLRAQLGRLAERSPYYRGLFARTGIDPASIGGIADLCRLPLTTKAQFTTDPESFRLDDDGDPASQLWDLAYTSGSTSVPSPIYQAAYDFHGILHIQRRMAQIRGMGRDDRIANLYPLTPQPHGAWARANHAAAAVGASVVCGMSGVSDWFDVTRRLPDVARLVVDSEPTVLWGVPSYLRRVVGEIAAQGLRLTSVRMLAVSGEATSAATAARLVADLAAVGSPAVEVSNSLGASEVQGGFVECRPGAGFHNPAPELFAVEAVGPDGEPVPAGERGALAITHLDRRGTALLRYLLGDIVEIDDERCSSCGRCGGRIVAHHGRSAGSVKIRGQLVDTQVMEQAVAAVPGVAEYRCIVGYADPADALSGDVLVVEVAPGPGQLDRPELARTVASAVKLATRVTPEVRFASADDPRMKPRRFVDHRVSSQEATA